MTVIKDTLTVKAVAPIDPAISFPGLCTKEIIQSTEAAVGPETAPIGMLRQGTVEVTG